jgi:hypothetical protein
VTNASYIVRKSSLAYCLFAVATLYIISPWFVERKLLFNELIAFAGLGILFYKRGRVGKDPISLYVILILLWGLVHALVSLFRMDTFYYYLRNLVIIYSILAFFAGYYCLRYLGRYIDRIRKFLRVYTGIFLFLRISRYLFERFGMAMLFPALFRNPARKWVPWLLIAINIIYGFTYDSLTALVLAMFYCLLFMSPGYKFFRQVVVILLVGFIILFFYLVPYLDIIRLHYNYYDTGAIHEVMRSNRILGIDGNNTWRLVLWKEIVVDHFPANLFGIGFGTPALKYFPVEDYSKLETLPYLLGSHNSFVYLFGRLGLVWVFLIVPIYRCIFREYFYHKTYYYANRQIGLFWSFFAITVIATFNPTLESPIYSGAYWLLLGFVARCINIRRTSVRQTSATNIIPGT